MAMTGAQMMGFKWGIDRSITGMGGVGEKRARVVDVKAVVAELIGMIFFVTIGCGTACAHGAGNGGTRLLVGFAFGMAIMVLAYSIGHHSGGHLNCAVTFSLVLGGQVPWYQGVANLIAQLIGSLLGACLLWGMFPCGSDVTTNLGSNIANDNYHPGRVLIAEMFGTFLLCFTVWETAVTPQASCGKNACVAIGFAVFLAHIVLLPIDGCSINPTRSFGPAVISKVRGCANYTEGGLQDLWIMWLGPLLGAALASLVQHPFVSLGQPPVQIKTSEPQAEKEPQVEKIPGEKAGTALPADFFTAVVPDGLKDLPEAKPPVAETTRRAAAMTCCGMAG